MILGIDNGVSGAICVLSRCVGLEPIAMVNMPTVKVEPGSNRREIDPLRLHSELAKFCDPIDGVDVFLEDAPRHAHSAAAMRGMAYSAGIIFGVLSGFQERLQWRIHRVKCGNALDGWQRQMLGTVPKGKTKEWALEAAKSIWPKVDWEEWGDGAVDAALIAEFGRRALK